MRFLFLLFLHVICTTTTFSQNLTKVEIDSYMKEIENNIFPKYSYEIFEGFYRQRNQLYLFQKPYSGSVVRNKESKIVLINEIFGNYRKAYKCYYVNETPVYILFYKKKKDHKIKLSEIYYLNNEYVETINHRKNLKDNLIKYARTLFENNKGTSN